MPYVFPYENEFVAGVGLVILVLLVVRVFLRKRQLAQERLTEKSSVTSDRTDRHPSV